MADKLQMQTRDSTTAAFWSERFENNVMPWDRGGVPLALQEFVKKAQQPLTSLIPGCGRGYEVAYLSDAGWDVTAIDFSAAAVAQAQRMLGPWAGRVRQADFFTYQPPAPVDFIYERAFLCALPPQKWPAIVQRWAELLVAGRLLGGFFLYGDVGQRNGPPFAADRSELTALLASCFELIDEQMVDDSVPVFDGAECWQVWRRR